MNIQCKDIKMKNLFYCKSNQSSCVELYNGTYIRMLVRVNVNTSSSSMRVLLE